MQIRIYFKYICFFISKIFFSEEVISVRTSGRMERYGAIPSDGTRLGINKFFKLFININSLIWYAINIYFALKYL